MKFAADRPLYNFENVSASSVSDRVFRTMKHISGSGENNSFTIALTGKWGSGKTSALNHILSLIDADNESSVTLRNDQNNKKSDSKPKKCICPLWWSRKEDDKEQMCDSENAMDHQTRHIVVKFNPWNVVNTEKLIFEFLYSMMIQIKNNPLLIKENEHDTKDLLLNFMKKILKYSKKFVPHQISVGIEIIEDLANLTESEETDLDIETLKAEISKSIACLGNYRILVVIDDIDRLSNEQIRCVFQMVSAVANFERTTYLLSFDRDIVVKALDGIQGTSGSEYMEKLVHLIIPLKQNSAITISNYLYKEMFSAIIGDKTSQESIAEFEYHFSHLVVPYVTPLLRTFRDMKRVYNAMVEKHIYFQDEIYLIDALYIIALELLYPEAYKWIKENKEHLTIDRLQENTLDARDKSILDEYADYLSKETNYTETTKCLLRDGLDAIFFNLEEQYAFSPDLYFEEIRETASEKRRIFCEAFFDRYFVAGNDDIFCISSVINLLYKKSNQDSECIITQLIQTPEVWDTFFYLLSTELIRFIRRGVHLDCSIEILSTFVKVLADKIFDTNPKNKIYRDFYSKYKSNEVSSMLPATIEPQKLKEIVENFTKSNFYVLCLYCGEGKFKDISNSFEEKDETILSKIEEYYECLADLISDQQQSLLEDETVEYENIDQVNEILDATGLYE